MPRKARVVTKGIRYHVVQRGNYRQRVFDSSDDKEYYIKKRVRPLF